MASDFAADFERERGRYADGEARLPEIGDSDERQRQLTRMGNAATGAGLALLMAGRCDESTPWFARAADRYHESFADAPPGSWGRPIGAVKARLLADDWPSADEAARWTLSTGAAASESPIGRYAACLAQLVLGDDQAAGGLAATLVGHEGFPDDVARALVALATADSDAYERAVADVLESFETRSAYLEDIAVADTVVVLQALARQRGLAAVLESPLLPARPAPA
jgi:hypothetical protein